MLVYLAGPIDYVDEAEEGIVGWRDTASAILGERGICTFDPASAFGGNALADVESLREVNLAAVERSTGMLACILPRKPSWGTPIEIEVARRAGVLVVAWSPNGDTLPPYLEGLPYFTDLGTAAEALGQAIKAYCSLMEKRAKPNVELLASNPGLKPPSYSGDVGYDLIVLEDTLIQPGCIRMVPVGDPDWGEILRIAAPEGTWATVLGRSGTHKRGLVVLSTVIDTGYRGPIYTIVHNVTDDPIVVSKGQRISQLVLMPSVVPEVAWLARGSSLPESERGDAGFGSTGE